MSIDGYDAKVTMATVTKTEEEVKELLRKFYLEREASLEVGLFKKWNDEYTWLRLKKKSMKLFSVQSNEII